jgi:hypothetical protein
MPTNLLLPFLLSFQRLRHDQAVSRARALRLLTSNPAGKSGMDQQSRRRMQPAEEATNAGEAMAAKTGDS